MLFDENIRLCFRANKYLLTDVVITLMLRPRPGAARRRRVRSASVTARRIDILTIVCAIYLTHKALN